MKRVTRCVFHPLARFRCLILVGLSAASLGLAGEVPPAKEDVPGGANPPAPGSSQSTPPQPARVEKGVASQLAPKPAPAAESAKEVRLSLDDAIRLALENNLQIQISRVGDHIRQRELVIAKAIFDPFFNMGATYAKNRDPTVSFLDIGGIGGGAPRQAIGLNPSERTSYSAGLSGDWVLGTHYNVQVGQTEFDRPATARGGITFLNPVVSTEAAVDVRQPLMQGAWYGVNTAEIRIAHNNVLISREELERITMESVFEVEQAYWELAFASQNLAAKAKALQVTQENLDNVRKKQEVGTLAAIDATTAESQVALRKVDLEEAELLVGTTRDRLLNLINYHGKQSLKERWEANRKEGPFDNMTVICTTEPSLAAPRFDRDQALAEAFKRRPEYRQLALNTENQQIRVEVSRNGLLPSLDVLARYAQLGLEGTYDTSYSELNSGRYYDWLIGVEFSVPLSNRAARSRYRNTRDELRKLKLQKKDLENQMVLAVDDAIRRIASLSRKVTDLDDRVRLQRELLQAERRKLEVGKSIAYTVSTIENDLVENVAQSLRAKADLQTAKADLYRVTGTLLQQHQITIGDE